MHITRPQAAAECELKVLPKLAVLELTEGTFTRVLLTGPVTELSLCQAKVRTETDGKEGCGLQDLTMALDQVIGLETGGCATA